MLRDYKSNAVLTNKGHSGLGHCLVELQTNSLHYLLGGAGNTPAHTFKCNIYF